VVGGFEQQTQSSGWRPDSAAAEVRVQLLPEDWGTTF